MLIYGLRSLFKALSSLFKPLLLIIYLAMPVRSLLNFNIISNVTKDFDELFAALKKFEDSPMCTYELLDEHKLIRKKGLKNNPAYP